MEEIYYKSNVLAQLTPFTQIGIHGEKKIFHMAINNDKFYVTPHNDVILTLTGWYDNDNYQERIRCEYTHPEEQFAMHSTILREYDGTATFESYIEINIIHYS